MGVLVFLLVAILAFIAVLAFQAFRSEKPEEPREDIPLAEDLPSFGSQMEDDDDNDEELVNLVDFFGANEKTPAPENPPEAEPASTAEVELDPLSDLKTGRGFFIDCQRLLDRAKSAGRVFAVAYFDFDRFRFINSLKGVSTGDYALTRMGQELNGIFPGEALCTRLSADHFIVLFSVVDENSIAEYAEQLRRLCDQIREDLNIKSGLKVCMGIAYTGPSSRDYDIGVLIQKANIARHCAKMDKNASFSVYDESMVSSNLFGESALDDYNENQFSDEIVIYFQPQADLSYGRIIGGEVLARWKCVDDVFPSAILSADSGKLPSNADKVFYQACRAISRWRKGGHEVFPVMIPLLITDLYKDDIDAFIGRCIAEFQLEPASLIVEIHANVIRADWTAASRQLKKIKELGVGIAVEGVDRGYADLEFLNGLPVDMVKLHRGFAYRVKESEERQNAVHSMLQAAEALGVRVFFEGVDSQTQAEQVGSIGVRYVQGYYPGRPCSSEEFHRVAQEFSQNHRAGNITTILDDNALSKGDFKLY